MKPNYVLKFRRSCPLNGGPLSLPTMRGIPSDENMRSSFGSTARALVVLTNSTSAHCECLHMATRRYSPVLIGPQKSMATSLQGSLGNGDIRSGSRSFAGVTLTWVAVLYVGFHHPVLTWKPDPSPEILFCFCNPIKSLVSEPDYFVAR